MSTRYHRLANRKKLKLILPLEKYLIIGHDHWHSRHITFWATFDPLTILEVGKIMVSKYWYLMLPGEFPDKITHDTDFSDEAVVQCDVPVVELLF